MALATHAHARHERAELLYRRVAGFLPPARHEDAWHWLGLAHQAAAGLWWWLLLVPALGVGAALAAAAGAAGRAWLPEPALCLALAALAAPATAAAAVAGLRAAGVRRRLRALLAADPDRWGPVALAVAGAAAVTGVNLAGAPCPPGPVCPPPRRKPTRREILDRLDQLCARHLTTQQQQDADRWLMLAESAATRYSVSFAVVMSLPLAFVAACAALNTWFPGPLQPELWRFVPALCVTGFVCLVGVAGQCGSHYSAEEMAKLAAAEPTRWRWLDRLLARSVRDLDAAAYYKFLDAAADPAAGTQPGSRTDYSPGGAGGAGERVPL